MLAVTLYISIYFLLNLGRLHEEEQTAGPSGSGASSRKKAKLDPLPNGSNIGSNGATNATPNALLGINWFEIIRSLLF